MALTISGNIQNTPLPDVLEGLRVMKATGTLSVHDGVVERSLYFEDGKIIFAASSDSGDRLGEVLVRSGFISRDHLENALQESRNAAGFKKLGAILVESGFLPPKDLFAGLKLQVNTIIAAVCILQQGTYQFDPTVPHDIIPLQINLQQIIQETIERMRSGQ